MQYSRLFREEVTKKEVYVTLQKQLELTRIDEVKQKPILHILDKATPPLTKSSPNRVLFLLTFGITGFLIAITIIVFRY